MKKISFLLFGVLLAACSSQKIPETTIGALSLPMKVHPGDQVDIHYKADSNALKEGNDRDLTLYYAVNNAVYAEALDAKDKDGVLESSFSLPDSAQAFALKFSDEQIDTNRYAFPVYDKKSGKPIAGALAAKGLFFVGIGNSLLGLPTHSDSALVLIRKDMDLHPQIRKTWEKTYLGILLQQKGKEAYPEIEKYLDGMLTGDSLQKGDYQTAYNFYMQMGMQEKAEKVKESGIQKFPDGPLFMVSRMQAFNNLKSVDSMVAVYENFKQKFGSSDPNSLASRIASSMARQIAFHYQNKGDNALFFKYASQMNDPAQVAGMFNNLAWNFAQSGKDLTLADNLSKTALRNTQEAIDTPSAFKPPYLTTKAWKKQMRQTYGNYADTYAMILSKQGDSVDALAYQKVAVQNLEGKSPEINERYIGYLITNGDFGTAEDQLERFFADGKTTDKMKDYLKTVYVHKNKTEDGYDKYLADLEKEAEAKVKADLASKMTNTPASLFTLPDLKGKEVSLASLKGKVVIVDFWATWCGPCKESFPGMQKAVDDFKADSNVVFLFVNTWEHTKPDVRKKQVAQFIAQNKYTFHVLMDQPDKDHASQFEVISHYGVRGIPTKFIIGPDGNIKFKKVGFGGSAPAEVQEISAMIELAKG